MAEDGKRLRKDPRQERILAELSSNPTLRVSELAARLNVSTETIRRDLDELDAKGRLNRTYGGAVLHFSPEPAISERHRMMVREREAIATQTARLINHGDVLMIGGGVTTVHVSRRLAAEKRDLTVIANSFGVATVLSANPTFRVILCPGLYNGREGVMEGSETVEFLLRFRANHAILGATGLMAEGPCEFDMEAANVYRTMAGRAGTTIVVADHTKFERVALATYFGWPMVAHLVTDRAPTGGLERALERARVNVQIATVGGD